MSSSRCPIPVPPRPPRIRVSSHDAAVTAAAEEGFGLAGGEKTGCWRPLHGAGRRKCRHRPLLLAISSLRSGLYTDESGGTAEEAAGRGRRLGCVAAGPEGRAAGNCPRLGSPRWAPLGCFALHPRRHLLLVPNGPFPLKTAPVLWGPSCSPRFQGFPLRLLPFPLVSGFGAWQRLWAGSGAGSVQWQAGLPWPTLSPLCHSFGECECLGAPSLSCEATHGSQLAAQRCLL